MTCAAGASGLYGGTAHGDMLAFNDGPTQRCPRDSREKVMVSRVFANMCLLLLLRTAGGAADLPGSLADRASLLWDRMKRLSHEYDEPSDDVDVVWDVYETLKSSKSDGKWRGLPNGRSGGLILVCPGWWRRRVRRFCQRRCGQTLNNDGLLSVSFNDEDCLAYVRDAYFLNR